MRHPNTRAIAEYWESLKRGDETPARDDLSPADMAGLLSHVFILQRLDAEHALFRLAGGGLCDLYQREFRDHDFFSLWRGADRMHMMALLAAAAITPGPGVVLAGAETIDGRRLKAEIFIAPLAGRDGKADRFLGLYQPLTDLSALGGRPPIRQHVIALYPPGVRVESAGAAMAPLNASLGAPLNMSGAASASQLSAFQRPAARPRPALRLVADNSAAFGGEAGAPA